jgi:outer membrane protein OmpA-like peptidoglycan-associated protein
MPGAAVKIFDVSKSEAIQELVTDAKGNYSFTIDDYKPLKAVAAVKGYYTDSASFSGPVDFEEMVFTNPAICLNPFPKENPFRMNNVLFDFDKYDLRPESYIDLERLVAMMNSDTSVKIEIQAHTDYKGTDEYNMKLSEKRAIAVMEYVVNKGISKDRVGYQAFGRSQPIAPNTNPDGSDNPEGRQLNRRIEVKVLNK